MLSLSLCCAFAPSLIAATAVIQQPVANMYSGPTTKRDVVSQAIFGTHVEVLKQSRNWLKVRTPDSYSGWVTKAAVTRVAKNSAANGRFVQVRSLYAHLYRDPDVTKHAPAFTIPFESRLEVQGESAEGKGWLQVRLPTGPLLWVQRGDVTEEQRTLSVAEVVELSKRFLGLPYTWGGTSSFGYDCSGFVQMLCRMRGIMLPRDAQPQADWPGHLRVREASLVEPGDLLFFGSSDKDIVHTGMYIGGGEFIHATTNTHPVIQISRLEDWTKTLVAIRRPK